MRCVTSGDTDCAEQPRQIKRMIAMEPRKIATENRLFMYEMTRRLTSDYLITRHDEGGEKRVLWLGLRAPEPMPRNPAACLRIAACRVEGCRTRQCWPKRK